ncbi:zincin-like metallopeptidase toxin domain-containing protein [uncultured Chryseobacterium sp.]|uniref:zincin-like metallopeptidase toxin domain-containing protein n=1 Tax=uncultured Chryseobacterium sp. TaxID=259322 RepID=UPI0025ED8D8E|nr:zincin-like metallopeptidase toxin domain-containing protein [uncultured Chryseobacterium sp.]
MSDFKNIVEFFRLNRRYEESEKKYLNNVIALTTLETKEKYELNTQKFNTLKLLRDIFNLFMPTEVFIYNNVSYKEFYVKTNASTYFNIVTGQVDVNVTSADVYPVPLEDFPFEQYFYDSSKNSVVIADILLKNIQVFPESIRYDPGSELLEDFSQQETLGYSYSTHQTWVYDFVSLFIPNNDAEDHPFEKHVSDSDVTVTQTRVTELISIIPLIRESIGKYYINYNVYKKDDGKIIPFYLNNNNFSDGNAPVLSLKFNSLGAFMAYLNDTIFSQTDNFTFGKRPAFIDQYKEIVILPLIRNLESRSTFSYYDALQALYYLPESLFYMLPEGFLWKFFDKAIANDSFSNKPYSKEEDIFLKILQALVSTEENAVRFIERLSKKVSEQNPQMLLEFFNDRIHGDNFLEFAGIVNKAWRKTRFVDYSSETNPEFASTDGPKLLPYHSEKLAGFFFSNVSASFEDGPKNKKERFLRFKFETGKTRKVSSNLPDGTPVDVDEQIVKEMWYHPFFPVKIKNTGEENKDQETAIQLDAIVPAFMLFANANQQFWHNVIKSGEYALDLAVIAGSSGTLSGIAAGEIIGTLAVARGVGAVAGITSSVANIILKLANAEDSVLGQAFCEYLFWIEMLSLGGELTIAIRNGLKRSAIRLVEKEEDLVRLEKQLDKTVEEGKVTRKEADDSLKELGELANADLMAKPNEIGKLGGKVLNASQIRKLRGELKQRGVLLILEEDLKIKSITNQYKKTRLNGMEFETAHDLFYYMKREGFAGAFDAKTKQLILSEKSTELVVFHEKAHLQHFEELGEEYNILKPWEKETYVFEKIWSQKHLWTKEELSVSLNYVNRERSKAGVIPLKIKL